MDTNFRLWGIRVLLMSETIEVTQTDPVRVTLTGSHDVRSSAGLQRSLVELVSQQKRVVIDCSGIDAIDAACLQILLATKREAQEAVQILAEPDSEASKWFGYAGLTSQLLGVKASDQSLSTLHSGDSR